MLVLLIYCLGFIAGLCCFYLYIINERFFKKIITYFKYYFLNKSFDKNAFKTSQDLYKEYLIKNILLCNKHTYIYIDISKYSFIGLFSKIIDNGFFDSIVYYLSQKIYCDFPLNQSFINYYNHFSQLSYILHIFKKTNNYIIQCIPYIHSLNLNNSKQKEYYRLYNEYKKSYEELFNIFGDIMLMNKDNFTNNDIDNINILYSKIKEILINVFILLDEMKQNINKPDLTNFIIKNDIHYLREFYNNYYLRLLNQINSIFNEKKNDDNPNFYYKTNEFKFVNE